MLPAIRPMLPAIRERPTKEAAKGGAKPSLSRSMVVSSLSYLAPHAQQRASAGNDPCMTSEFSHSLGLGRVKTVFEKSVRGARTRVCLRPRSQ
jgi:hypothetical protein